MNQEPQQNSFHKGDKKIINGGWLYKIVYEHTILRSEVGSILGTNPHFLGSKLDIKVGPGISDI